jgi:hypothetical protein
MITVGLAWGACVVQPGSRGVHPWGRGGHPEPWARRGPREAALWGWVRRGAPRVLGGPWGAPAGSPGAGSRHRGRGGIGPAARVEEPAACTRGQARSRLASAQERRPCPDTGRGHRPACGRGGGGWPRARETAPGIGRRPCHDRQARRVRPRPCASRAQPREGPGRSVAGHRGPARGRVPTGGCRGPGRRGGKAPRRPRPSAPRQPRCHARADGSAEHGSRSGAPRPSRSDRRPVELQPGPVRRRLRADSGGGRACAGGGGPARCAPPGAYRSPGRAAPAAADAGGVPATAGRDPAGPKDRGGSDPRGCGPERRGRAHRERPGRPEARGDPARGPAWPAADGDASGRPMARGTQGPGGGPSPRSPPAPPDARPSDACLMLGSSVVD